MESKQNSILKHDSRMTTKQGGKGFILNLTAPKKLITSYGMTLSIVHPHLCSLALHVPSLALSILSFILLKESICFIIASTIFHTPERIDMLHHRFMAYYKEFEGNIQSCYALYNAHLHKRAFVFAKQVGILQREQKDYDG